MALSNKTARWCSPPATRASWPSATARSTATCAAASRSSATCRRRWSTSSRASPIAGTPAPFPRVVFEKPPSAELRPDQKDSDSLPEYDVLDRMLRAYVEECESPRQIADELDLPLELGARHRQQSRSQRVQAPAGRPGPEGHHQGVRRRTPLPDRAKVHRMKYAVGGLPVCWGNLRGFPVGASTGARAGPWKAEAIC